jgi:hypothetical protein
MCLGKCTHLKFAQANLMAEFTKECNFSFAL